MTTETPKPNDDWLGYGAYASTLWDRIERALKKDDLGDDPLVIGLFGEWGAGKSYLLSQIKDLADAKLKVLQQNHEGDAGFMLTVPVFFQPWKYEHEKHLHVPMAIHVLNALKDALKHEASIVEATTDTAIAVVDKGKKVVPAVQKTLEVANAVYPIIQKMLKSFTLFGCSIDLPIEVGDWLETTADGVSDIELNDKKKKKSEILDKTVKHSDDGTYFYRFRELLEALTRPYQYEHRKDLFKHVKLTAKTHINFVVFIDDLDRCLPEKAVQTLELIKTMFNVDSFAFVLALDDEVIERGIAHRYKDYALGDKKSQMPITGFEYLEKIVHLPFKLPALTHKQAKEFIVRLEEKLTITERRWFERLEQNGRSHLDADGITAAKPIVFDLGELALSSFDAYVPRKLTRLVELWYNTIDIAQKRYEEKKGKELIELKVNAQVDARIAFTLLMVQLFHPDLYRVFRRYEQTFKAFYESFVPDGLSPSISDIDLWRWAAFSKHAEARGIGESVLIAKLSGEDQAIDLKSSLLSISKLADGYRFDAQQRRLPLVERIIEHRAAQRHVFDALKLFQTLKTQMPALPNNFKIAQYFSLLAQFDEALIPAIPVNVAIDSTKRFTTDANLLYEHLISVVESTQSDIPILAGFDSGHVVDGDVLDSVHKRVAEWLKEASDSTVKTNREKILLRGLTYLARFIAPHEQEMWWGLVKSKSYKQSTEPKVRANWYDACAALGKDLRFKGDNALLAERRDGDAVEAPTGFVKFDANTTYFFGDENQPQRHDYDYYMSRYNVTVAQYAAFVSSADNASEAFWAEHVTAGAAWRFGQFQSNKDENFLQDHLERRPQNLRNQPMNWAEQQAFPNRPVTGVSWFEATAYAAWLEKQRQTWLKDQNNKSKSEKSLWSAFLLTDSQSKYEEIKSKYCLRLPIEDEWERAAKCSKAQKYPWSDMDAAIEQLANVAGNVGAPTTVGSYPSNNLGLYDMAGNVWQWQANIYKNEYRNNVVKVNYPLKKGEFVSLRGGSWASPPDGARCSYRGWNRPDGWGNDLGFRLVLSIADFES